MKFNIVLLSYLIIFFAYFAFELLLLVLQKKNLNKDINLEKGFANYFSSEFLEKSKAYSLEKLKLGIFNHFYSNIILLGLILSGFFGLIYRLISENLTGQYLNGIFYIYLIMLFFSAIAIPTEYFSTFVIEEKFGFNKSTRKLFFIDKVKATILSFIILFPLLLSLFFFIYKTGSMWWLYAFCFLMIFQLLILYVYPVFIAPLFNKFEPIKESELKKEIFNLSKKLAFPLKEVFVMDGSKRSSHGNAYFTGFGKNQRIVLFDTIVNSMTTKELLAVLAHEIGHKKLNHIKRLLIFQSVFLFFIFYILGQLYNYQEFFIAFGFSEKSPAAAIIIFSIIFSPVTYFFSPIFNYFSRKHEFEADNFANQAMTESESLKTALLKLHKDNLSNLFPHPIYSFFHYSHPPLMERLKAF